MKIDLKDHQGVQEYLDFLHGEIKTKDATIAEQGAEIASFIEDQKEEYNKTEDRFVDYEDEIAEQGAEIARLAAGLNKAMEAISDYVDYEHDELGEDRRAMGEMFIDDMKRSGDYYQLVLLLNKYKPAINPIGDK